MVRIQGTIRTKKSQTKGTTDKRNITNKTICIQFVELLHATWDQKSTL